MLGKITTSLLLSLGFTSSFAGFYIGASTGPEGAIFYQNSHVVGANPNSIDAAFNVIDKEQYAGVGVFGSIFGGYGHRFDRLYLALEGNVNISSLEYRLTNNELVHRNFSKTTFTIDRSAGIGLLPGYILSETTLLYGRVAYSYGHLKISESDPSINSITRDVNGFRWGLGARFAFSPKLLGMIEYSQTHYQSVRSHTFDPFGVVTKDTRITPYVGQVAFGIIYSFDEPAPVYVK